MENMQYAEELVREFLVFRGFTSTLQAFETELRTDIGKGFQVDKILDLIFSAYIPKFEAEKLVGLLSFFKQCLSASLETALTTTLSKLEVSILRYYIVHAIQSGRKDKVVEFFAVNGNDLLQRGQDWTPWFAIPYVKNPSMEPQFRIYFSKDWFEALRLSVRNFFSEIFNGTRVPALLKISSEKNTIHRLKKDIKQLNAKLSQLQALLEEKDAQLYRLRDDSETKLDGNLEHMKSSTPSTNVYEENHSLSVRNQETSTTAAMNSSETELAQERAAGGPVKNLPRFRAFSRGSSSTLDVEDVSGDTMYHGDPYSENGREMDGEENFPEVKVDFQETFLGHTSPISCCRFSASGDNIASASMDGTVRYFTGKHLKYFSEIDHFEGCTKLLC